jgi:Ca2+/H+ antiporter
MELAITVAVVVIVLSILVGYSLFKGGKEMQNNNIKMAGIYWLLITTISIIILLITYSSTSNLGGTEEKSSWEDAMDEAMSEYEDALDEISDEIDYSSDDL